MLKFFTPLFFIGLLSGLLSSCAIPTEEEEPTEPVKAPVVENPLPQPSANPADDWRILADDTKLPTEAQLADGAESSLGSANPAGEADNRPSTSVKPPPSEPEDQLAPSE